MNPPDEMMTAMMRPEDTSTMKFSTLPIFSFCKFRTGVPMSLSVRSI